MKSRASRTLSCAAFAACLSFYDVSHAQEGNGSDDYGVSAREVVLADPVTLPLDADGITSLAPNLGKMSGVKPDVRNYMILWSKAQPGSSQVEWTVNAPADGVYEVTIGVNGVGMRLAVSSNGKKVEGAVKEVEWHHLELGEIPLKAGENQVLLEIEAPAGKGNKGGNRFLLGPMELAQPAVRAAMLKEAKAARVQPDWFKDAGYGLMFQWTNRATPPKGDIKQWEQKVEDFDMDGFVKLVEDSGAAYVVWSITWGNQYISAPIKSLDAIIAGRTTKRDLLGEMTERLHEKGVKVIFYYHYGYDCMHSVDKEWMEAAGGYEADKTKLYTNLGNILSEIGTRYGEKLDGWWFDGGERYLNCHFDGSSGAEGMLSVPFREYTAKVKTGNPQRMVAYNSWIRPRVTEYQDYYGGEGQKGFDPAHLTDGVFNTGRQKGLQAHGCFILERSWGHIEKNKTIPKPKFSLAKLTGFVKKAQENRYPLSINLEMYEDGSVSPASHALLKELKAAVRK